MNSIENFIDEHKEAIKECVNNPLALFALTMLMSLSQEELEEVKKKISEFGKDRGIEDE